MGAQNIQRLANKHKKMSILDEDKVNLSQRTKFLSLYAIIHEYRPNYVTSSFYRAVYLFSALSNKLLVLKKLAYLSFL